MNIFGFTIFEIASFLGVVAVIVGFFSWAFKLIVISPLQHSMDKLSSNISLLNKEIVTLKDDNKDVIKRLDELEIEVASKGIMFEEQIKNAYGRISMLEKRR